MTQTPKAEMPDVVMAASLWISPSVPFCTETDENGAVNRIIGKGQAEFATMRQAKSELTRQSTLRTYAREDE